MNKLKKEKGITLIALVVTIIVLIILAGISINLVLGNNGIITKARDARSNFARAANEEQTGLDALLAEMNEKIDGNSSKGTLQIPEELKVGDTISYTPSGSYVWDSEYYASTDNDGSNSYPDNFLYTGSTTLSERRAELEAIAEESRTDAQKKELAAMENAKDMTITSWRVLSIDRNNNTVKLVPAEALGEDETDSVFLQGAQGYNNGVYLIKEACERLYSDSSKGATAESITIEDIENAPNGSLDFSFDGIIEDIPSNEPVKANLNIKSLGEFIKITGTFNAKLVLVCDLCLKEYQYDMHEEIDEMFAKNSLKEEYGAETELKSTQFVNDLNGDDKIDIYDLLYQSVILNIPNKKVCGINCSKGKFQTDEEFVEEDPRMQIFKNIKIGNNK